MTFRSPDHSAKTARDMGQPHAAHEPLLGLLTTRRIPLGNLSCH